MSETEHAILGASSMYRWKECPGSIRLCKGLPNIQSAYALEGTIAHDLAAKLLEAIAALAGHEEETAAAIQLYVDTVLGDYANATGRKQLFVEHRFDLSKIHPDCFGTADAVTWTECDQILRVYDYKHGRGHKVEVEANVQLLYYALGALVTLGFAARWVEIVVVQPRCKHKDGFIRRWRIPSIDLLEFEADLVKYAKATEDPNAPLVAGSHCFFCQANELCPAQHKKRVAKAADVFSAI